MIKKILSVNSELNDDWIRNIEGYDDDEITKNALSDQSDAPPAKNPEGNNGRGARIRLKPLKKGMDVSKDVSDLLYGVLRITKGGPGSGDWGHRGRPGKVGGSAERGGFVYTIDGQEGTTRHTISRADIAKRRQAKIEAANNERIARLSTIAGVPAKKKKVLKDPPAEFVEEHFDYRPMITKSNEIIDSATGGKFKDAAKFIYNAYEFEHTESGMKARVTDISPANHYISINGEIVDSNNNFIGRFERVIHETGEVHNDYFRLDNDSRGSGFGASFYKNAEDTYLEAGIDNVTIYANIDVGGYAWARMGFDFRDDYRRQSIYEKVVYEFMRDSKMDFADATFELSKYGITNKSKAYDFAAFTNPKTGTRIGKNAMLGTDWHAVKKVDPNDPGWLVGQAYYDVKLN